MAAEDDLPADFELQRAAEGERVQDLRGTTWVVLVDRHTDERRLVHEDVVQYEQADHPVVTGAAGFVTMVLAMFAPLIVTVYGSFQPPTIEWAALGYGAAIAGGFLVGRVLLHYTPVGRELLRFLEWWEHKELIEGRDLSC